MPTTPDTERPSPVAGTDDDAISTYGRLVEVVRRLDRTFAASLATELALPVSQFEVLLRLGRSPADELTMSALASQLGVTPGGATRLVARVIAAGWVTRRGCPDDRRVQHVRLTAAGREVLRHALVVHRADLARELITRLSTAERAQLDDLLDRLRPVDHGPPAAAVDELGLRAACGESCGNVDGVTPGTPQL